MEWFCDVCDKTIEIKSERNHLCTLSHKEISSCIRIKYFIQNPDFFDEDSIVHEYITNLNEKFDIHLIKYDFTMKFIDKTNTAECSCNIKPELEKAGFAYTSHREDNLTKFYLKRFLLLRVENFINRGYKFSHLSEMCMTTVDPLRNMSYQNHLKQAKPIYEFF